MVEQWLQTRPRLLLQGAVGSFSAPLKGAVISRLSLQEDVGTRGLNFFFPCQVEPGSSLDDRPAVSSRGILTLRLCGTSGAGAAGGALLPREAEL